MRSIEDIADEIVAREGGYVNDPDDPGGATKHGVTIGTLRDLGLDKTGDGRIDTDDVRALTRRDARDIFLRHYYFKPRINDLPEVLQASVFDMQVNSGANAIRILQELLTDMGFACTVDGVLGPQTLSQAARAAAAAPDHIADAYGIARRDYYYRLADRRPSSRKYARRRDGGKGGWIRRAEEFIAPKYHLSDADHRQRTASWA
jgi:lysozyme family protein